MSAAATRSRGAQREVEWLARGSARQRSAWAALRESDVFDRLAPWDPVLAGTFPLDLDVEGSDLDVLVEASDLDAFELELRRIYGGAPRFVLRRRPGSPASLVAGFVFHDTPIEVFAQPLPSRRQVAYRHLVVERRLLEVGGDGLRCRVRELKRASRSTEEAFAEVLGLPGDPYLALLELEALSDAELVRLVRPGSRHSP